MSKLKNRDHLYKRGRIWYVDIVINGERVHKSLKTTNRDDAKLRSATMQDAVRTISKPTREIERTITLGSLMDLYIDSKTAARRTTLNNYKYSRKSNADYFGDDMRAVEMSEKKVREFSEYDKKRGAAVDSMHHRISFLKSVYKYAHKSGYISRNPIAGVIPPKQREVEVLYYTDEEVKFMLDNLEGRNHDAVLIAVNTGMRKNEILNMRFPWIRWKDQEIVIPAEFAKSKRNRQVPISDGLRSLLESLMQRATNKEGFVLSHDGGNAKYENIRKAFFGVLKKLGKGRGYNFHTLRKTFSTKYLEKNPGHFFELMEICGWTDIKTAMKYATKTKKFRDEQVKRMPSWNENLRSDEVHAVL